MKSRFSDYVITLIDASVYASLGIEVAKVHKHAVQHPKRHTTQSYHISFPSLHF
jgi:hypothetical protein